MLEQLLFSLMCVGHDHTMTWISNSGKTMHECISQGYTSIAVYLLIPCPSDSVHALDTGDT